MADTIKVDPEALRSAADQLGRALAQLNDAASELRNTMSGVEEAWQSRVTLGYIALVQDALNAVQRERENVRLMQRRLRRSADAVEQTERNVSGIINQ